MRKPLTIVTLAAIIGLIVGLLYVNNAQAHNTRWFWNKYAAQVALLDSILEWELDDGTVSDDYVEQARCQGTGRWITVHNTGNPARRRGFKHFRCFIKADTIYGTQTYFIKFHVTGENSWDYEWLRWAR